MWQSKNHGNNDFQLSLDLKGGIKIVKNGQFSVIALDIDTVSLSVLFRRGFRLDL
jgi:hypothetical protein